MQNTPDYLCREKPVHNMRAVNILQTWRRLIGVVRHKMERQRADNHVSNNVNYGATKREAS